MRQIFTLHAVLLGKLVFLLNLLFLPLLMRAQQPTFRKGTRGATTLVANDVQPTPNGGFIIAGYRHPAPSKIDLCLAKTDSMGDILRSRLAPEGGIFGRITPVTGGGYILAGAGCLDQTEMIISRISDTGSFLWHQRIQSNVPIWGSASLEVPGG